MNIDLWHSIEFRGESSKKNIWAHHFTIFSHQDSQKGFWASILSIERLCVMILSKPASYRPLNTFFLNHRVFKHPQNCVHRNLWVLWETFRAKIRRDQEKNKEHFKLYRQGLPTSDRQRGFRPRHRPMWITHGRSTTIKV